jgi:hypothetical protein
MQCILPHWSAISPRDNIGLPQAKPLSMAEVWPQGVGRLTPVESNQYLGVFQLSFILKMDRSSNAMYIAALERHITFLQHTWQEEQEMALFVNAVTFEQWPLGHAVSVLAKYAGGKMYIAALERHITFLQHTWQERRPHVPEAIVRKSQGRARDGTFCKCCDFRTMASGTCGLRSCQVCWRKTTRNHTSTKAA